MATGPQIPSDPIELLTPDLTREEPLLNKYWGGGICAALVFAGVCVGNYATSRPIMSGIQKHIIFSGAAAFIGNYIDNMRVAYFAERDAVFRHYIQLHAEDFPAPERKKFGEVLEPWIPIR